MIVYRWWNGESMTKDVIFRCKFRDWVLIIGSKHISCRLRKGVILW